MAAAPDPIDPRLATGQFEEHLLAVRPLADPLVRGGSPLPHVLLRARTVVDLHAPVEAADLAALLAAGDDGLREASACPSPPVSSVFSA